MGAITTEAVSWKTPFSRPRTPLRMLHPHHATSLWFRPVQSVASRMWLKPIGVDFPPLIALNMVRRPCQFWWVGRCLPLPTWWQLRSQRLGLVDWLASNDVFMFSCFNTIRMWRMLKVILFQWCRLRMSMKVLGGIDGRRFKKTFLTPGIRNDCPISQGQIHGLLRPVQQCDWHTRGDTKGYSTIDHHNPRQVVQQTFWDGFFKMFQKLPLWSFSQIFAY